MEGIDIIKPEKVKYKRNLKHYKLLFKVYRKRIIIAIPILIIYILYFTIVQFYPNSEAYQAQFMVIIWSFLVGFFVWDYSRETKKLMKILLLILIFEFVFMIVLCMTGQFGAFGEWFFHLLRID